MFKEELMRTWSGFIRSGYDPAAGSCEHGNELGVPKKAMNFLTK